MHRELYSIAEQIEAFIGKKPEEENGETRFNELALKLFECQVRLIEPYGRFCRAQNKTPETVTHWTEIPPVPADAFKRFFLFAGEEKEIVQTFRSSGTTQPGMASQAHFSREGVELMGLAVETNARKSLFPDGVRPRTFVLAPDPSAAPHMIMVHGMSHLLHRFATEESHFWVGPQGLQVELLLSELESCCRKNIPVALMGSSFGFVHLFDEMERLKLNLKLPQGSRLMDAGGYKGKSREIDRQEFIHWAASKLGLAEEKIVNLLGMTEMASQIYDATGSGPAEKNTQARRKESPHWVRTRVMNPIRLKNGDLQPVTEEDQPGLLRHLDLANVERPLMIQTEDVGVRRGSGFEVLRRVKGAEPRGCSLSFEEFSARGHQ